MTRKGYKQSQEHIDKRTKHLYGNQWNVGKHLSAETKKKMSETKKGKKKTAEACLNFKKRWNKWREKNVPNGGLLKCRICSKEFRAKRYKIKDGAKYCSFACYIQDMKNRPKYYTLPPVVCQICHKEFRTMPYKIKNGRGKYCSKECAYTRETTNETRIKMRESNIASPYKKFKDTSIELKVENELLLRRINFQKQVPLCKVARVDFLLKDHKVVIQCDGCYWHGCPIHYPKNTKKKDIKQDSILRLNGYKVYRFWEHDINNSVSDCIDRIPL
jgi:DNA mismatch endonuclease (patch repair protein)